MKPLINLDFSEVKFDNEQIPNYTREFMDQMRDHMYHVRKFEEMQKNQIPKLIPQRPMSAQAKKGKTHQEKHKYLKKKEPPQIIPKPQATSKNTSNAITLGQTYISETIPVIQSNLLISGSDVQLPKQPNSSNVCKKQTPKEQNINNTKEQNINNKPLQLKAIDQPVKKEVYGLFDWEDEIDGQFYIKEAFQLQEKNKRLQTAEQSNREQFLQKVKTQNASTPKEQILRQQQIEIQQKQMKLEQLRQNHKVEQEIVRTTEQEDDYGNDFEDEDQHIKQPIQQEDDDYGNDGFEAYDEGRIPGIDEKDKEKQLQKPLEVVNKKQLNQHKTNTDSKSTLTQNSKKRKKFMYRPKNAKERKQELVGMREELEKNIIQNDPASAQLHSLMQESKEKEKLMIDLNMQRKEQLALARLTLQQLQEKIDQQLHIIDDLDTKEHYAQQIIEKLKENRNKQQQQYDNEIEKFLACKVIARLMKGKKDRKLYLELRRQNFMNMLKQ
ncbi:unnamed protein product (macronuclear) [Paramecium tetraurelia]|uniref:Uncharacterized protein n=1 Tax=Paramecium tetraurelia TaxID=5888 RepID=A0E3W8_PARTE|nr:uncharacterized protein GSPATT00023158001 [Paramecium tetraurelia]CAK89985.1 unnamed protein product [Paramecium tetraurelia]|eukprot:XP_001457382.1 hypothetical protein (macronuclear) [Paramecium tetraurelia strain d4-2]